MEPSIDLGLELVPRSRALRSGRRLVATTFVIAVVVLSLAPWQQSVSGTGRVIAFAPLERQQELKAPIAGRVVAWHVQEGERIAEGQAIATIEDNDPAFSDRLGRARDAAAARREAAVQSVRVYEQQVRALEVARAASIAAAASRIEMAVERARAAEQGLAAALAGQRTAALQIERQRGLESDGLTSTRNLELAELAARLADAEVERGRAGKAAADGEVRALRAEQQRTDAATTAEVERARASLQGAQAEVARYDGELVDREVQLARQGAMKIVAPRAGTLLRQVAKQGGEYVAAGAVVAVFVPDAADRAVELWLAGRDAPLVTVGRHVRVQFEGWPAVQFVGWPSVAVGTFGGIVAFVDAAADARGRIRVVVVPEDGEAWPEARFLRQGTRVNGWVLLDRVRLGFELWRQWNGFPPAVAEEPSP